ncbi:hypothetical protein NN3_46450 [Nocardia neocaledoniensis NBRC 108232]|nr:hypothetical protein NN3_46450 [Nocardia neocaledoniensis NBRC 108232]
MMSILGVIAVGCGPASAPGVGELPLREVGGIALSGGTARFDYTSLDPGSGALYIAHMGAGEVIEVDTRAHRVVRTIADLPGVHGVLAVPGRHQVFATVTDRNQMATIDADTGVVVRTTPTGEYPDGLAYDSRRAAVWTTNEHAGTETVIDADTGVVQATVGLGGEVGNVVYDVAIDRVLVGVQGRGEIAVIDPATFAVTDRIGVPGCAGPHGLALDGPDQVVFVGCEGNATLVTVDLTARRVTDRHGVGPTPDVLVYDEAARRLYVAAESGWVSVFDYHGGRTTVVASRFMADGAHTLALDPGTHHSFFPLPRSAGSVLREFEPTP